MATKSSCQYPALTAAWRTTPLDALRDHRADEGATCAIKLRKVKYDSIAGAFSRSKRSWDCSITPNPSHSPPEKLSANEGRPREQQVSQPLHSRWTDPETNRGAQTAGSPDSSYQDPWVFSLQRDPKERVLEEILHSDIRLLLQSKWFSITYLSLSGQDDDLLPQ